MRRLVGLGLSLVFLVGMLSGCGNSNLGNSANSTSLRTLKVGYMPNMGSASALVTGIKMGYFKQEGLNVQLVQFSAGPGEIAAMASGNIDISQIGNGAHTLAAKGKADIICLDDFSIADEILGNKDKGVNSISDLRGKKIATSLGSSSQLILDLALASKGMTEKDVTVVNMDPSSAVTAMVSGNIAACAIWSPSTFIVKQKMGNKIVMLANDTTFKDKVSFPSSFVVTPAYAQKHQTVLVKFVQGLYKAMDYRAGHIKQVADWVASEIKQDPSLLQQDAHTSKWLTSKYVFDAVKDGTLKKMYQNQEQVFLQQGLIPSSVNVDNYVLYNIMTRAYEANNKA
ncbi:SsuA/THI5-like [Acididesulfobacillus acetoxydans]|uniref:NLPA lipoprotein n=1 Tax=Acididesulfobacillus acetoxydans TaxID=1561005 RepID=A0A8S0XW15_9FIRM|nr:aliphatic sulfonate ABC transporter substrate-binding protein [Acididesulfobacillus acetoxydans]CAA7600747.1 SsuA/THI5-like [Acididesulfobacillus acetoxydans]CEJ07987.1 NLPA lipoprotein [Acididesulfobacillus acetoxydans]